jgi:hypothetical protein
MFWQLPASTESWSIWFLVPTHNRQLPTFFQPTALKFAAEKSMHQIYHTRNTISLDIERSQAHLFKACLRLIKGHASSKTKSKVNLSTK